MTKYVFAISTVLSFLVINVILAYAESTVPVAETCGHTGCQDGDFSTYWSETANYPGSITWSTDIMVPEDSTVHIKSAHGGSSSRGHLYQYVQKSQTGENYCIYPVVQSGSCTYLCSGNSCADSATADTTVTVPMSFDRIISGFAVTWQTGSETFYAYEADVTIHDTTPPVITLLGDNPLTIFIGNDYTELGATCNDDFDGDISSNTVIDSSSVNTSFVGQYLVTYDCADNSNNAVQVTRVVNVVNETVPPTITIPNSIIAYATGEQTILSIGMATATDNFDPNPAITNDAPDSFPHGITTVTWTATDSSANKDTATQIIMVIVPEDKSADDGLFYFSARANSTVSLYASFEDYSTFTLNCKFFEAGTNSSDTWYNQTTTFYVASHDTANTIYARCYNNSGEQLFQIVEYAEYGIGSGFDSINETLGHDGLFGVPLPFLFVLVVASIWTGRSAQVGVIITAGTIGIMGMMGLFELSAESWALIVLLVAAGVFMGKKLF